MPARLAVEIGRRVRDAQDSDRTMLLLSIDTRRCGSAEASRLMPCLDDRERHRALRLVDGRLFVTFVTAHAALRIALAHWLRRPAKSIEYAPGAGKPRLAAEIAADTHFSLSHSHEMALIGLRRGGEIGVDIERIDPAHPLLRHAARIVGFAERPDAGARNRGAALSLFRSWTRKEAYLKALGGGIDHRRLGQISLCRTRDGSWTAFEPARAGPAAVVHDLGGWTRFCAAVCCIPPMPAALLRRIVL